MIEILKINFGLILILALYYTAVRIASELDERIKQR